MPRPKRAYRAALFWVAVLALAFLVVYQIERRPASSAASIQAECVDPLAGVAATLDDARYILKAQRGGVPAGATVILRLPGVEYPDTTVVKPVVTAALNGKPLRVDDGDRLAGCPSPSRSRYDVRIHVAQAWAAEQPLEIVVKGYRLPFRAVQPLPVEFFLETADPSSRNTMAAFQGTVSADKTVAVLVDAPTAAYEGWPISLKVSAVDQFGNPSAPPGESLTIWIDGKQTALPKVALDTRGRATVLVPRQPAGVHRFSLYMGEAEIGRSGPVVIGEEPPAANYYWGDPHSHTYFSDGFTTASPADAFAYARDTAHLDFAAVTDHAEPIWGCAMNLEQWRFIETAGEKANVPGEFITLLGYEWTGAFPFGEHWPVFQGHAHVLFPDGGAPCRADTPECGGFDKLLAKMKPYHSLVIRHHVCVKWAPATFPATAEDEMPVVEVASSHGSCECASCPGLIPDRVSPAENYVQAGLLTGAHYGLVGGSDNHHAMPGARAFAGGRRFAMNAGGVTCVLAGGLARDSVFRALRERRCYATTGARIFLDFNLANVGMGQVLPRGSRVEGRYRVYGVAPLEEIVIWRADLANKSFEIVYSIRPNGLDAEGSWRDSSPPRRGLYYLRARQTDGEMAWSSPIWIE